MGFQISQYVYFNTFREPTPVYKTSTFGPVNVTTFSLIIYVIPVYVK